MRGEASQAQDVSRTNATDATGTGARPGRSRAASALVTCADSRYRQPKPAETAANRARSSAVEHYLDMVGVTGSIPVAPTTLPGPCLARKRRNEDAALVPCGRPVCATWHALVATAAAQDLKARLLEWDQCVERQFRAATSNSVDNDLALRVRVRHLPHSRERGHRQLRAGLRHGYAHDVGGEGEGCGGACWPSRRNACGR